MIEVRHLTKKYGAFTAVNDVSFTVEKRKIYGFLGPNGAGKSTTMNIITGCLAPTSGTVTVNGHDIYEDPIGAKASVGYLPELPPLYPDMTPEEYLLFVGEAKGLESVHLDQHVDAVMETTRLTEVKDRLIRNLSKGYRQRVGIAQAILGDPEIVILDEPTVGLDPLQIIEIRDLIRRLGEDHTVILSSHILSEISAVCDTVIIISRGRIVASDTLEHLTASADGRRIITLDARGAYDRVEEILRGLSGADRVSVSHGLNGCIRALVETAADLDLREDVFRLFAAADCPIVEMTTNDVSLEDVFLRLTEEPADDGEVPGIRAALDAADGADDEEENETEEEAEAEEEAPDAGSADAEEDADSPYYDAPKDKKSGKANKDKRKKDPDDYTPLFGGKE